MHDSNYSATTAERRHNDHIQPLLEPLCKIKCMFTYSRTYETNLHQGWIRLDIRKKCIYYKGGKTLNQCFLESC